MNWKEKSFELWGDTWKAQLSKLARVNPRTVRRWATGELNIKQTYIDKINVTYELWRGKNKNPERVIYGSSGAESRSAEWRNWYTRRLL